MEQKRAKRRLLRGRHPLTVGALALLGLSGYELWIRLEDFWAWTSGIRHLSQVRGTPFLEDLGIIFEAPEMRQLGLKLAFLLAAVVYAVICVICRNRGGAWVLLALDIALAAGGGMLGLYSFHPASWAQVLKLIPLALIAAGCVINIAHHAALRRQGKPKPQKSPRRA